MNALAGKRIFIVEDEPLILMSLEDMLEELGCELAGSATTLADGLRMAEEVQCDAAILDININGQRSEAIAGILQERGVPCVYATGYGRAGSGASDDALVIEKPYNQRTLVEVLVSLFDLRGR